MTTNRDAQGRIGWWSLLVAVLAALGASACCVGPLLLLLGVGGAWASHLTTLERYRPVLTVLTLGFLGYAFYRTYRAPAAECCTADKEGARGPAIRRRKAALRIAFPVVIGLLTFPYLAPRLFANGGKSDPASPVGTRVVLELQNMSCASCALTVKTALSALRGVKHVSVSAIPPQAVVIYDPQSVSVDRLTQATRQAGFPTSPKATRTEP